MIKYKLICEDCENEFDSWFSASKEYEKLKKLKYLNCHLCGSLNIKKTLMSPFISNSQKNCKIDLKIQKNKDLLKKINEYQIFIKKNFDYVGKNFSYEARLLHYKDKKNSKGIFGSASREEIKQLNDEGIEVNTIPWLKNKIN